MDRNDIPLGFGFSLAQDPETMKKFSALPRDKQARILKTAHEHVDMLCADKGEYIGVREARKHLGWYIKGMSGAAEARRAINASETKDELFSILNGLK